MKKRYFVIAFTIVLLSANALAAFCDTLPPEGELAPWLELIEFRPPGLDPGVMAGELDCWGGPRSCVQPIVRARGELNLDYYSVTVSKLPTGFSAEQLLTRLRLDINDFVDTTVSSFQVWDVDRARYASDDPVGSRIHIEIGFGTGLPGDNPEDASVVLSEISDSHWRFTTITAPGDGYHPVSGHRQWGFIENGDGSYTFYTRGADRPTTYVDDLASASVFYGQDALWRSLQRGLAEFVNENGGQARTGHPIVSRYDWDAFAGCFPEVIARATTPPPTDPETDACSAEAWLGYWDGTYRDTRFDTANGNFVSGSYGFDEGDERGDNDVSGRVREYRGTCYLVGDWSHPDGDDGWVVFFLKEAEQSFEGKWGRGSLPTEEFDKLPGSWIWHGSRTGD